MMKLSNIESRKLLPRFASKIAWLMDALDSIIKPISERVKSIDAPLTLEAIAALTDEELEALYNQYGVAQYYPELSRSTRDLMLYEMCKIYRYLGTPHAIELLCNYIFDNVPLNVHVIDNLAFDEHGTLTDATLLDVFDIEVNPDLPVLSVDATARLLANIIRFSRNSQALRDVIYTFSEDFDLYVYPLNAGIPAQNWDNDAICEPVTPPTPAYTEVTLYMASGTKYTQGGVTSAFTAGVTSTYCYKLYTDEECAIEWDGYDYSNDYVVGRYRISDGEWFESIDSVAEMPAELASSTSSAKTGYILMDFSRLWLCTNYTASGYLGVNVTKIVVRIYPKDQQYYSLYGGASGSAYNNVTISNGGYRDLYGIPNRSSNSLIVPWGGSDASLPTVTLQAVLGSAGNLVSGISLLTGLSSFIIQNSSGASREFRTVVFTLSRPTIISYTNTTNTVVTVNSSTPATLYDDDGNMIPYNANYNYITLGAFSTSGRFFGTFGAAVTSSWAIVQNLKLTANGSGNLQVEFVGSQTLSINKIWYTKTPSASVSKTGNFGQYNWIYPPDQNTVLQPGESCILDDSGTPGTTYAYDSTKSYGVLQWQTESGTRAGATELQIVGIEQGGQTIIGCKNVSSASVTVSYVRVCVCSSSSATVVSVYNSSNVAYNAFKLSLSGTDYYYVLDNTQTTWVADLSSIGYSLSLR